MIALFFDTETTGFKSSTFTPEIVQIGAILQDTETRRIVGELNVIVQPQNPIPEHVSAIHGITDEIAARCGIEPGLAAPAFQALVMKADIVVAHNLAFDVGILHDAWPIAHRDLLEREQYCTMRAATPVLKLPKKSTNGYHDTLYPNYKAPKLIEAYRHFFGVDFENAHDAMADVRACRDVYFKLMEAANAVV